MLFLLLEKRAAEDLVAHRSVSVNQLVVKKATRRDFCGQGRDLRESGAWTYNVT